MWESMMNLKTCEIGIKADLSEAERQWLLREVMLKDGVRYALYHPATSRRLLVEYDADRLNPLYLVDFLTFCGVHAEPAPARIGQAARKGAGRDMPLLPMPAAHAAGKSARHERSGGKNLSQGASAGAGQRQPVRVGNAAAAAARRSAS